MSNKTVVVTYKTIQNYCSCCGHKLTESEIRDELEIELNKEDAMRWVNWNDVLEYPEDMEDVISEFLHGTISFWATHSGEKIVIAHSEVKKVKEFILQEVITRIAE